MNHNKIFIVRHGESENNVLGIDSSSLDNKDMFGLTENGRKQMEFESKKFRNFDLIFTSPLRRAVETAKIFAAESDCEVIDHILLNEVDFGDLELCSYKKSDAWLIKNGSDESIPFPNGESLLDAKQRVIEFFEFLNKAYKNKRILIVTHGHIVLFLRELHIENFDRKQAIDNYDDDKSRKVIQL